MAHSLRRLSTICRTQLSQTLASLKEHVNGAARAHESAARAAAATTHRDKGFTFGNADDDDVTAAVAADNAKLRETVAMMRDEMVRMNEALQANSPSARPLHVHTTTWVPSRI
jgi:hypothetical protein